MERIAPTGTSTDTPCQTRGPIPHDLHIPSAPPAPASMTREQVDTAIAYLGLDDVWGRPNAWRAFGDGAA